MILDLRLRLPQQLRELSHRPLLVTDEFDDPQTNWITHHSEVLRRQNRVPRRPV